MTLFSLCAHTCITSCHHLLRFSDKSDDVILWCDFMDLRITNICNPVCLFFCGDWCYVQIIWQNPILKDHRLHQFVLTTISFRSANGYLLGRVTVMWRLTNLRTIPYSEWLWIYLSTLHSSMLSLHLLQFHPFTYNSSGIPSAMTGLPTHTNVSWMNTGWTSLRKLLAVHFKYCQLVIMWSTLPRLIQLPY